MADAQVPWGVDALGGAVTEPAWRSKPSWYLVATDDRMIPPPAQRTMSERAGATVTETPGSHAVYVSNPAAVAGLITQAARSASARRLPSVDLIGRPRRPGRQGALSCALPTTTPTSAWRQRALLGGLKG